MKRICLLIILTICAMSVFSTNISHTMSGDSVGIKQMNGSTCIVYKVSASETVYSISRKYGVPYKSIVEANVGVDLNAVKIGQEIFVPIAHADVAKNETVPAAKTVVEDKVEMVQQSESKMDKVVPIEEEKIASTNAETLPTKEINSDLDISSTTLPVVDKNKPLSQTFTEYTYTKGLIPSSEKGVATWIEGSNDLSTANERYYALHNTAPIGSVIKIRNLMNNRVIYAKVIGTLSDSEVNEKVLVKLSSGAGEKLNVLDNRFVVEITFFQASELGSN